MPRPPLILLPLCPPQAMQDALDEGNFATLAELLQAHPAASRQPFDAALLTCPLATLTIRLEAQRLHLPLPPQQAEADPAPTAPAVELAELPSELSHGEAVQLAYQQEIAKIAGFLRAELSVLVHCDKLLVPFLQGAIATLAGKRIVVLEEEPAASQLDALGGTKRSRLRELLAALKTGDLLVLPHLDLLAAGDGALSKDARALVEDLFGAAETLVLAFADRSLNLPEVIGQRFAVRLELGGLPRLVSRRDRLEVPLGCALVTAAEAASFTGFDPEALYKNVAGLNPIRLRQALAYARGEEASQGPVAVEKLYHAIRAFKAQTTANFTVPDVTFAQIGGYGAVKTRMLQVLSIMLGAHRLPNEALRRELLPRGFIFHGPPGTGKTLFAKAVANKLNATIQVVSGPEVTDMYVGESERKVRALFAEARRNAPAVLVFDEFDAIATQRSNRDDGGSRAGNALVAQILTEMDGFRPEVPVLVIGTTNRLDIIDDALLRPSRFQAIEIGLPDLEARLAIARVHAKHFGIAIDEALLHLVAQATEQFNGDQVRNLFREACVGLNCHQPPLPADAERFGFLVGQARQEVETRASSQAKSQQGSTARYRDRPPTNAMTPFNPEVSP